MSIRQQDSGPAEPLKQPRVIPPPARPMPTRVADPTLQVAKVVTRGPEEATDLFSRIRRTLDEVRAEVLKVSWPNRDELRNLTIVVIAITSLVGVTLGLFDALVAELVRVLTTSAL